MKGEQVKVYKRVESTKNDLNEPVYIWNVTTVEDVLVRPIRPEERQEDAERPNRVRARYTLAFPKTFTDDLTYCKVALIDRGMDFEDALEVIGTPDRLIPCPTKWNILVNVGRVDG